MKKRLKHLPAQFRWAATTVAILLLLLLCIFAVAGCGGDDAADDDQLPPYVRVVGELISDGQGAARVLRSSDGREQRVLNELAGLSPDSLYRIETYVLECKDGVELYNAKLVFSPMPQSFERGKMKADPVAVVTAWREPRYVNMRLAVGCSYGAQHLMAFADEGLRDNADGSRTQLLRLYHDAAGDRDDFRQELLASCPVYQLADVLRAGVDSVQMTIATPKGDFSLTTLY